MIFNFPNSIGHVRLLLLNLALISEFYNLDHITATILTTSIMLDILDGKVARFFNQCTDFGITYDIFLDVLFNITILCILEQLIYKILFYFFTMGTLMYAFCSVRWQQTTKNNKIISFYQKNGEWTKLGSVIWYGAHMIGPIIMYIEDHQYFTVNSYLLLPILSLYMLSILSNFISTMCYIRRWNDKRMIQYSYNSMV